MVESACGLGCLVFGLVFGVFVPFSTICLFFPSFNDDLGTMPTRRPYSWKKMPASRKQQSGKHRFGCAASRSGMPQATQGGLAPPAFPHRWPVGSGQGLPAAFQNLGAGSGGGVPKIPGADLRQPPPPMTTNPMSAPPTARLTLWAQALALKPWNVKGLQGSSA